MTTPNARRHTLAGTSSRRVHADATDRRQSEPNARAATTAELSCLARLDGQRPTAGALVNSVHERHQLCNCYCGAIASYAN